MEKRSKLSQITLCHDGYMLMRFLKQVVDDDGTIIAETIHVQSVAPWEDPEEKMAFANERLSLKHAPVSAECKAWLKSAKSGHKKRAKLPHEKGEVS